MSISRRRPTPWLHRWSRPLIGAVALMGALVTGYLTYHKFTGSSTACPTGGCDVVLNSPYASVFGLPLSLFGFLAYFGMAVLALGPLAINPDTQRERRKQLEGLTWPLIFAGATAMVIFSGYLMTVLFTTLNVPCLYCIASALFTLTMLVLTLLGREWTDVGNLFFIALVVGMITLLGSLGMYGMVSKKAETPTNPTEISLEPEGAPKTGVGWSITTTSGEAELQLAKHLNKIGAQAYFAWFCSHCYHQKQLFGEAAVKELTKTECDSAGVNAKPELCQAAKITGYPSWVINGQLYSGVQSLQKLAKISGYTGPTDFKNFPNVFPQS
jgi:uncharacterized membrane protein